MRGAARAPLRPEQALGAAMKMLARAALSRAQLAARLERRGLDEATVAAVCERLAELRLLDDAGLARRYVERERAARGELALRAGLQRLGIDEANAQRALVGEDEGGGVDEAQQRRAARELLQKHAWRFQAKAHEEQGAPLDPQAARRALERRRAKAARFLASRGFRSDAVAAALGSAEAAAILAGGAEVEGTDLDGDAGA